MTAHDKSLTDFAQRATAILAHDRSLLVEAGRAPEDGPDGRADRPDARLWGEPRRNRGRDVHRACRERAPVARSTGGDRASGGRIPKELKAILPQGLTGRQAASLEEANARIEEITCTTIHGFCQRLIKPYPVEANIDPGASVLGRDEAEQRFEELMDAWLEATPFRQEQQPCCRDGFADPSGLEAIRRAPVPGPPGLAGPAADGHESPRSLRAVLEARLRSRRLPVFWPSRLASSRDRPSQRGPQHRSLVTHNTLTTSC